MQRQPRGLKEMVNHDGPWVERVTYVNFDRVLSVVPFTADGREMWTLVLDNERSYTVPDVDGAPNLTPTGEPLVLFADVEEMAPPVITGMNIEARRLKAECNGLRGREVHTKWQLSINGILLGTGEEQRVLLSIWNEGIHKRHHSDPILDTAMRLAKMFNVEAWVVHD